MIKHLIVHLSRAFGAAYRRESGILLRSVRSSGQKVTLAAFHITAYIHGGHLRFLIFCTLLAEVEVAGAAVFEALQGVDGLMAVGTHNRCALPFVLHGAHLPMLHAMVGVALHGRCRCVVVVVVVVGRGDRGGDVSGQQQFAGPAHIPPAIGAVIKSIRRANVIPAQRARPQETTPNGRHRRLSSIGGVLVIGRYRREVLHLMVPPPAPLLLHLGEYVSSPVWSHFYGTVPT